MAPRTRSAAAERARDAVPVAGAAPNGPTSFASPPKWEPQRSTQIHDDMNLFVLFAMALLAAISLYHESSTMQYKLCLFAVTYMVLDAIWILFNLDSVKSAKAIVGHHIATVLVLSDPLLHPGHAVYACCALLVEYNTLLLILRRRVSWGSSWLVEIPFAISWVALRLVWYPFLAFYFILVTFPHLRPHFPARMAAWHVKVEGSDPVGMFYVSYVAWVGICIFQFWWSQALFKTYKRAFHASKSVESKDGRKAEKFL